MTSGLTKLVQNICTGASYPAAPLLWDPIVSLPSAGRIRNNHCLPPELRFNPFLFSLPLMNWYLVLDKYAPLLSSSLSHPPPFLLPYFSVAWKPHMRMSCLFCWAWNRNIPMCFKAACVDCFFICVFLGCVRNALSRRVFHKINVWSDSWTSMTIAACQGSY